MLHDHERDRRIRSSAPATAGTSAYEPCVRAGMRDARVLTTLDDVLRRGRVRGARRLRDGTTAHATTHERCQHEHHQRAEAARLAGRPAAAASRRRRGNDARVAAARHDVVTTPGRLLAHVGRARVAIVAVERRAGRAFAGSTRLGAADGTAAARGAIWGNGVRGARHRRAIAPLFEIAGAGADAAGLLRGSQRVRRASWRDSVAALLDVAIARGGATHFIARAKRVRRARIAHTIAALFGVAVAA